MSEVILEVKADGWRRIGSVSENEPPGSLSSDEAAGREVYLFGFMDSEPGVWRSHGGIDTETPAIREVVTTGFDRLADLTTGSYEFDMQRASGPIRCRFSLILQEVDGG